MILAVIVVPVMHAFLSSAKINAKARKIAQATTLAQNTMEEIQAGAIEDYLAASTRKMEGMDEVSGTKYYKYVYDSGEITVEGTTYEIKTTFSSNFFSENDTTFYNDNPIARIYDMNDQWDASYVWETDMDEKMAAQFSGEKDTVLRDMKREIIIDVEKSGAEKRVELGISYTWNGVTKYAFARNVCIYSNSSDETKLRNIYLFYCPLPNGGTGRESIVIRNHDSLPVNVYLICQGDPSTRTAASYDVDVKVTETGRLDESYVVSQSEGVATAPLVVNTHLRTNVPWENENKQLKLEYGTIDGVWGTEKSITINGTTRVCKAKDLTDLKDLSAKAVSDRVYKVTVKVYEEDNTEPLATISGAKTE